VSNKLTLVQIARIVAGWAFLLLILVAQAQRFSNARWDTASPWLMVVIGAGVLLTFRGVINRFLRGKDADG
jgi:hypothetical protein